MAFFRREIQIRQRGEKEEARRADDMEIKAYFKQRTAEVNKVRRNTPARDRYPSRRQHPLLVEAVQCQAIYCLPHTFCDNHPLLYSPKRRFRKGTEDFIFRNAYCVLSRRDLQRTFTDCRQNAKEDAEGRSALTARKGCSLRSTYQTTDVHEREPRCVRTVRRLYMFSAMILRPLVDN